MNICDLQDLPLEYTDEIDEKLTEINDAGYIVDFYYDKNYREVYYYGQRKRHMGYVWCGLG